MLDQNASLTPPSSCHSVVVSSGSGLEGQLFGMGMWSLGLGAVGAALAGIFLANTDLCLQKAANATLEYLEDTDLRSTVEGRGTFSVVGLMMSSPVIPLLPAPAVLKPVWREICVTSTEELAVCSLRYCGVFV